jgi:membrane protein DedA with SNARE-associated domain
MQTVLLDIINHYGYLGVFLLIAIENLFPPIPSELILTFGGFMTTSSTLRIWGVILAATLGSLLGAVILYYLGSVLDAGRLEKLVGSRLGRMLRLKREDIEKSEAWFVRYGSRAIFFGRFVPIVRSLISIPAGMSKMNGKRFLLLTTLGTLIWNTVLVYLGRLAGQGWEKVSGYFDFYTAISAVVLIAIVLSLGFVFVKKRFLGRADSRP